MAFFRQYIAPFFIFLIFLVALAFVSSRIFLPADMAAPAPIEMPAADHLPIAPDTQKLSENPEKANLATSAPASSPIQTAPIKDTVADLPPALSTLVKGLPDEPTGQL